ncbi:MAG TPA: hypothetical protein VK631_22785 [Solirubrobacteraceae bacterium]|nr:hypothetical protein [Solirubrobacteraceae bacterium]
MSNHDVRWIDALGAEFAGVAAAHETPSRRPARRRVLAMALSAVVLLGAGAYAVPVTRAAIEDVTSSLAGWVSGDEGRALRPDDDAPDWVRDEGGRVIAETDGVELYVSRTEAKAGALLRFTLGDGFAVFDTVDGWRARFDDHAVVVLGASPAAGGEGVDDRGRFPLLGVTARSVAKIELRYADGPPLVADDIDGGFVLMADARRARQELVAYDAAGRELERTDVSEFGPLRR